MGEWLLIIGVAGLFVTFVAWLTDVLADRRDARRERQDARAALRAAAWAAARRADAESDRHA